MIRTLAILAVVSFLLSIGCLAAAFAIAGGPFTIDDGWRFHRHDWNVELSANSFTTESLVAHHPRSAAIRLSTSADQLS